MTTYFAVSIIEAPDAVFEEHDEAGQIRFLDATGLPIEVTATPLHYLDRHWVDNTAQPWMVPADPVQQAVERAITTKAFLLRFTQEERIAVRTAARASVAIDDWLHLLESDVIVHLDSSFMAEGIHALLTSGFITDTRAKEIIGGTIQPFEVPNA